MRARARGTSWPGRTGARMLAKGGGMKIGKLHCPPILPLWDTFVSGHRSPTINFTYLPLSRLSPALKLKISSIVIALHACDSCKSIVFIKYFAKNIELLADYSIYIFYTSNCKIYLINNKL